MDSIVIVSALRTAIGAFNGTLSNTPAHSLGAHVIKTVIEQASLTTQEVDQVIMGQVLTAGQGQNPARQAAILSGVPAEKAAMTINQVCGAGLRSVALGAGLIQLGEANIIVAGGQENMSLAPHAVYLRKGVKLGNNTMVDTMIHDGLWDSFNDYHMGITAENIAEHYKITRKQQDQYAAQSQQRAEAAINAGKFKDEIIPITIKTRKEEIIFDQDEFPRFGTTEETLAKLKPAFKKDGTVTPGNASGINDGAAAVVLMTGKEAQRRGLNPLVTIKSLASAGVEPAMMGTGPIPASQEALKKAGWGVKDVDLIESNEAFAAQACCVIQELNLPVEKTNVNGGAIALGHPIGASGTRCLVTLIHEMKRRNSQKGLVTLCIGGGMGIAMCIERST